MDFITSVEQFPGETQTTRKILILSLCPPKPGFQASTNGFSAEESKAPIAAVSALVGMKVFGIGLRWRTSEQLQIGALNDVLAAVPRTATYPAGSGVSRFDASARAGVC